MNQGGVCLHHYIKNAIFRVQLLAWYPMHIYDWHYVLLSVLSGEIGPIGLHLYMYHVY